MSTQEREIVDFLKANVTPMKTNFYGTFFRAAAYLTDGTYLPCVMFGNPSATLALATRRFSETRTSPHEYSGVVRSFVITKSTVPIYNIGKVELSPYAWPEKILNKIHGETTMGWTAFTAKMSDGKVFGFGTSFHTEFFDLPAGYTFDDIIEIHSGKLVDKEGEENDFTHEWRVHYYRERPFFNCYSDLSPT